MPELYRNRGKPCNREGLASPAASIGAGRAYITSIEYEQRFGR